MLVVIDESGCTGFKRGSSSHFVIAMVIFDHFKHAEETANILRNVKQEIGHKKEFHFTSCNNRVRDAFFDSIKKAKFKIRIIVVDKQNIYSNHLQKEHEHFANFCLKHLVQSAMHRIEDAVIKIDGKGSRIFKKGCTSYLRKETSSQVIKSVKFCNSKNDLLIQLADMIVSAYSRPYNNPNKSDAFKWRNSFEEKIENVWNFK
ncbi:MAG: DUF3800 domain-containing protein [Alphaproteobacteria bacterium]|nr:DUF3800 domain-containing protein [Alphaproteobacteria bacterium]